MLASVSARNHGASHRLRAAVLCFGGWGLQTMLHLWPRLHLVQEEREVLGIDGDLPNLDRLTAFAAILPVIAPAAGPMPESPFQILLPNLERYPAPNYLERQRAMIEAVAAGAPVSGGTHGEYVGARLLKRAQDDGYVRSLPVTPWQPTDGGSVERLDTRLDAFRAGVDAAGPIARALLTHVIDPTRLDSRQTQDPFVQTTIFVIAPLAEPRASALVWPVISELVGAFRRRHVSRVIALFSTASFAPDEGRAIEEATAYMSLRELEALTGSSGRRDRSDPLSHLIAECGGTTWAERVGQELFDRVYLIDREKSNQALAESALELSVLTGNAIEAFLTADGLGHMERSLGPDVVTGRPSYSVLGAASDHIPLAEYIVSAIEEEQKEVIRSVVLAEEDRLESDSIGGSLQALGAAPDALARRFVIAGVTPTFGPVGGFSADAWLPALRVAEDHLLSKAESSELREAKDPGRWQALVEQRIAKVAAGIMATYAAARAAWGLLPDEPGDGEDDPVAASVDDLAPAESAGVLINGKLIPKAVDLATAQIVADTVAAPDGILRARERLSSWLGVVAALLHDLQQESGVTDNGDDTFQARLDAWRWAFTSAVAGHKQHVIHWIRIVVIAYLSLLGVTGFILLQRIFDMGWNTRIAMVVGVAGASALLAIAAWVVTGMRMRRLKRQRIELAQEDLSRLANRLLRRGLFRAYSQLFEDLTGLQAVVEEAFADLSGWAHAEPDLQTSASDAASAPTRASLIQPEVWDIIRDNIRQKASDGTSGAARFRELWREEGSGVSQWLPEGNRLARRLRAALDQRHRASGRAPALAGIFREYGERATEYLSPTHRLYADHAELVREVVAECSVERLLLAKQGQEPAGLSDRTGAEIVENLYLRAKPSAGYEVTYSLSSDALEVEFGVCADGQSSQLRRVFEQRGMPLLTSKDPLTFSVVRTVNRLGPSELILTERCRDEFARLSPGRREKLSLLPADESGEAASLYRETDEPATIERQVSLAAGRE